MAACDSPQASLVNLLERDHEPWSLRQDIFMAETAGLVIGAVSLASLFTDCIDCFNYVRVGRALEDDFPLYQTELDVLQLRFSRWAQAVAELSTARSPAINDDMAPVVDRVLKQIARLFQRAREDAEDYVNVQDTRRAHLDPEQVRVHTKLRTLIDRRQKITRTIGVGQRTQWALYKKEEFVTLIINLRTRVDDLEALISVADLTQRLSQMRQEDAEEVQSEVEQETRLVEDSAMDVDPDLGRAVEQIRSGHSYSKTEIGDYSAVQLGDSVAVGYSGPLSKAYNTYTDTKIGKHAQVSMGTMYGRTLFDKA